MGKVIRTLAIDIGGTGLKATTLDEKGKPLHERVRVETPRPATPSAVLAELVKLVAPLGHFDRVSVGFPGVVVHDTTMSAPNLHESWREFPLAKELEKRLKRPTRVLNDAGVQGYGVIKKKGTEMVLTLGTGMGCAIYVDGHYVPNIELAHHPFHKEKTYEDYIGQKALKKIGKKRWNKRVAHVLEQIQPIFNPTWVYLGGGNAKKLTIKLPKHVRVTDNTAGLLGGIELWHDR
jgi:polyphosphate glucokinase